MEQELLLKCLTIICCLLFLHLYSQLFFAVARESSWSWYNLPPLLASTRTRENHAGEELSLLQGQSPKDSIKLYLVFLWIQEMLPAVLLSCN